MRAIGMMVAALTLSGQLCFADGSFDNRLQGTVPDVDPKAPLSSVIALSAIEGGSITQTVRSGSALSPHVAAGVRVADGLKGNVVVSWLQPINEAGERFGANNDFLAWFGDEKQGLLWVSHEYLSGAGPRSNGDLWTSPVGDHATLARWLVERGSVVCEAPDCWNDQKVRAAYVAGVKASLGGSMVGLRRGEEGWRLDPTVSKAGRYPASSATLLTMTGPVATTIHDHDDSGVPLPEGVVAGTIANCSGGVTPWGTVLLGEENVQSHYGTDGEGLAIAGAKSSHDPGYFGWATEIDPEVAPGVPYNPATGRGHAKHSALGRARWENFSIAVGVDNEPVEGSPLTVYFADDRNGGRVHKFVSAKPWRGDMSRAEKRRLLIDGTLYVSSLDDIATDGYTMIATGAPPTKARPGKGEWIAIDEKHLTDLFAYEENRGIFGQNRPEDVEWLPGSKTLYIAYTGHKGRGDRAGRVWAFVEGEGNRFAFYEVAAGNERFMEEGGFAHPDNLVIGSDMSLWVATDGQPAVSGGRGGDAFYYLDIDPTSGAARSAKRIVTAPFGAEITGPAFTPDMTTLFLSMQHPGERGGSSWPVR